MKFRLLLALIVLGAVLLAACSFSLAEDITPPPNYKSPTPAPTMGPLFPAEPPDLVQGAAIYVEKCQPCHGASGMGDGPQGKQLEVVIPPFGLPEVGRKVIPTDYYTVVTQGRIDKFMPPFVSLTDQQRWNAVAYVLSLDTTPAEITTGRELYAANCAQCHGNDGSTLIGASSLTDQAFMAKRSDEDLFRAISNGSGNMPGFSQLSEDERWALAAFTRTLTFGAALAQAPAASATPEPTIVDAAVTPAEGTAAATSAATPQATSEPAATTIPVGTVSGSVVNGSGGALPSNLQIKLQAFEHDAQNPSSAPAQVLDLAGTVQADGSYLFENIEFAEGRFFVAVVMYNGVEYQSPVAVITAGQAALTLEPLNIYDTTTETAGLKVSQAHVLAQFDGETVQLLVFYILTNNGDKAVAVETDGTTLPFIPLPEGATALGIDPNQGQLSVVVTETGFLIPPATDSYGMLAAFSLPYKNKAEIKLPIRLDISSGSVLVPENIKVKGDQLAASGTRDMGDGATFAVYTVPALAVGDTLVFNLSGKAATSTASATNALSGNQSLLIGIGALGLALIGAGVWLYLRDRRQAGDEDEDEEDLADDDDDSEEVMDAIIALDDQYRAGNISEEAYQQRRAELKSKLKKLL
jgi:mono/diheme cytochrome c family protein/uncharacterized membrane protein